MDINEWSKDLLGKTRRLKDYVYNQWPGRSGNISLRFIDSNFRMQGWQGSSFQPWLPNKKGTTILVKTSTLRRGNYAVAGYGEVAIRNDVPYGRVHNDGFDGMVQIPAHSRRSLGAKKISTGRITRSGKSEIQTIHTVSGIQSVRAHARHMHMPKRQFFPNSWDETPVLKKQLVDDFVIGLKTIFNN